jgi:hypothetical protein
MVSGGDKCHNTVVAASRAIAILGGLYEIKSLMSFLLVDDGAGLLTIIGSRASFYGPAVQL